MANSPLANDGNAMIDAASNDFAFIGITEYYGSNGFENTVVFYSLSGQTFRVGTSRRKCAIHEYNDLPHEAAELVPAITLLPPKLPACSINLHTSDDSTVRNEHSMLSLIPDIYVKIPSAVGFERYGEGIKDLLIHEAGMYERMESNPHPNIVRFQGNLIRGGRLRGICLTKYHQTLAERFESDHPIDIQACLSGIWAGIKYLHEQGLAHNDIRPSNILLKHPETGDDTPAISDFETCYPDREKLVLKAGVMGGTHSSFQNDLDGFNLLKRYLDGEISEP